MNVFTVDDPSSLLVCDGSLDVVNVVVFKDVLSGTEMHSLELLL